MLEMQSNAVVSKDFKIVEGNITLHSFQHPSFVLTAFTWRYTLFFDTGKLIYLVNIVASVVGGRMISNDLDKQVSYLYLSLAPSSIYITPKPTIFSKYLTGSHWRGTDMPYLGSNEITRYEIRKCKFSRSLVLPLTNCFSFGITSIFIINSIRIQKQKQS